MSMTPAMESIFANAQQNAASLIETATLAINAKVNTIEEAEQMIQELSSEAVKYNELLTTIMNAMRQVESGDMQKEEAAGIITPAVKELKDKCTALKIANAEAPGDDITEDEIAILRELIIGAKAAAEDRLVAIRLGDDDKVDPEVEAEVNTPDDTDEEAEEGFIHNFIERRHQAKVNKAKIDSLWDSMKDKKATAILNQFAKAAAPLFSDSATNIKSMVDEMIRADQKSGKDYTGKISSKDYIIKNYGGYTLAIMPATTDGLGCNHILAPVAVNDGDCFFFKKNICEILMNPIKKDEVAPAQEAYEAEIAEEAAFLAAKYVHTNETKIAKALYVNAKKLYSMGSKDKALQYMKQAKSLYEKALDALMKSGKFEKAERTEVFKKGGTNVSIRKNITRTDSMSFNIARSSLESKIDRCAAHILQWTTKAGKETYQQTLDQLKADREQAKAAKKAAKATENYEMEDNNMEFMEAYESIIDQCMLEEMDYETATEGTNWDAHKLKKSYSKEIRSLAKEAKKNYKVGNYAVAKQMYEKCVTLCNEMASEVKSLSGSAGSVQIGNMLHGLKTIGSCLLVGSLYTTIKEEQKDIDMKIAQMNKAGKGELSTADLNKYINDIASKAKKMADKFKKLADKAGKGQIEAAGATESFDYDEFMFACEAMMDELQMDLDTDVAMEADGADEGGSTASSIGSKLRSAMAKFKSAFKRGDKKAAEEAKKEVDSAADELSGEAAGADENKKAKLMKAAKVGLVAAGTVAAVAGLTAAGIAISQKAKGEKIDIGGGAKAMKTAVNTALHNMKPVKAIDGKIADHKNRLEREASVRNAYGTDTKEDRKAGNDAVHELRKNSRNAKKAARKAAAAAKQAERSKKAETGNESYSLSEYDLYDIIYEALMDADESFIETDADLASAIESMI